MDPAEFKQKRKSLGLTQSELANRFKMEGPNAARTIRRWERGETDIPGLVEIALNCIINHIEPPARR